MNKRWWRCLVCDNRLKSLREIRGQEGLKSWKALCGPSSPVCIYFHLGLSVSSVLSMPSLISTAGSPLSPSLLPESMPRGAGLNGNFQPVWSEVKVTQPCPTLCDPMDYTVHGILQARILEWVAIPFAKGSSQPGDRTQVSCIAGGFFSSWATREAQIPSVIQTANARRADVRGEDEFFLPRRYVSR